MTLTRRDLFKLGGLGAATVAASACGALGRRLLHDDLPAALSAPPTPIAPGPADALSGGDAGLPLMAVDPTWRLLNRAGYGPRPGDAERVAAQGVDAYLAEQLAPDSIDDQAADLIVRGIDLYHREIGDLINQEPADAALALGAATLARALASRRQLFEAVVEFWSDHFNIYLRKNPLMAAFKIVDDRDAIRPHALGRFADLLSASAHSPAMLIYLDNAQNRGAAPNENYARELLELHTLGVDGGYDQDDVREAARALSGWTVVRRGRRQGQVLLAPGQHDDGAKTILGVTFPAGQGVGDIERLIALLAEHPSTARFLAHKLARRFVADEPPADLVADLAGIYAATGGDIRAMLRHLFTSDTFRTAPPKLKRPYTYLVSALRSVGADVSRGRDIGRWLNLLGQPLFQWAAPNGYPDVSAAWAANLLPRWNFALALLTDRTGARVPFADLLAAGRAGNAADALNLFAGLTLGRALDDEALDLLVGYVGTDRLDRREAQQRLREAVALIIASPAFQWT